MNSKKEGAADATVESAENGKWEVSGKKSRNRATNASAKQRGGSTPPIKASGHQEMQRKPNMATNNSKEKISGNTRQAMDPRRPAESGTKNPRAPQSSGKGWESALENAPPAIPPPLQNGWQWGARAGSSNPPLSKAPEYPQNKKGMSPAALDYGFDPENQVDSDCDDDELEDSDDDILSDNYDSDASEKSFETRKKSKRFKTLFAALDNLSIQQLDDPIRQWHCPACHGGPGQINWYKGLQALVTHTKTKGGKKLKQHRELAELLEEELVRRGTSAIPATEAFGKWQGLRTTTTDHEIVWPPMVIIRNTVLGLDENEKQWTGMGNQELLDYFESYQASKARHSYGPQGHRGFSVLIFEPSAIGYMEAERLHKHFAEQGTDRDAWDHRRVLFYPGGKRQLYGYLATNEDLDYFNQHCQGKAGLKARLKYEMRSYQEMVVGPMKQMGEDNQLLPWLKNKIAKQRQHSKALEETVGVMSTQLRIASEENRIVRHRTKIQHEENKEEMDYMEQFFKEKMAVIHEALEEKEKAFEEALQEDRAKAKLNNADSGSSEDCIHRQEEIERFIKSQSMGIEEFEEEREKMVKSHEMKKTEMKRKHYEEEVELEKEFDAALTQLMQKYAPCPSDPSVV